MATELPPFLSPPVRGVGTTIPVRAYQKNYQHPTQRDKAMNVSFDQPARNYTNGIAPCHIYTYTAEDNYQLQRIQFGKAADQRQRQRERDLRDREEWEMTGYRNVEARQRITDDEGRANWLMMQRDGRGRRERRGRGEGSQREAEGCVDKCCCYILWVFGSVIAVLTVLVCLHFMSRVIWNGVWVSSKTDLEISRIGIWLGGGRLSYLTNDQGMFNGTPISRYATNGNFQNICLITNLLNPLLAFLRIRISRCTESTIMPGHKGSNNLVLSNVADCFVVTFCCPWSGVKFRPVYLVYLVIVCKIEGTKAYVEHAVRIDEVQAPSSNYEPEDNKNPER